MCFKVCELSELLTLHGALLEAKFAIDPEDLYLAASPVLADLMDRLIEEIEKIQVVRGPIGSWEQWRANPNDVYLSRVVAAAVCEPGWSDWTRAVQTEHLEALARPFVLSAELLEGLRFRVNDAVAGEQYGVCQRI